MKMIKFYDTSSLLLTDDSLFDEFFAISSVTLEELEHIKVSAHKDNDIKLAARKLINMLDQHIGEYKVVYSSDSYLNSNDQKIMSAALAYAAEIAPDELIFVTNDLCLKHLAMGGFNRVESIKEKQDEYTGYKNIILTDDEMERFYTNPYINEYGLLTNEYAILHNEDGDIVDIRRWDGTEFKFIETKPINSKYFGKISAQDIQQKMAIDSLRANQLTVLRGKPGSGKSLLGLSYLFSQLESYKIDRIFIFCNPVATRDAARLGFYPGDRNTKLLDSQIGNFLVGKLGDMTMVEQFIDSGKLVLVPAADCRGMDIPSNSGVYITEAQNSTRDLMKLMLQRIGEGTKVVIEGDDKSQVDMNIYEGSNNGLHALSQTFRGNDFYGEVTLQKIHRSKIAEMADNI